MNDKKELISRAKLMGKLTSSQMQAEIKSSTGVEAYNKFLELLNCADLEEVIDLDAINKHNCAVMQKVMDFITSDEGGNHETL